MKNSDNIGSNEKTSELKELFGWLSMILSIVVNFITLKTSSGNLIITVFSSTLLIIAVIYLYLRRKERRRLVVVIIFFAAAVSLLFIAVKVTGKIDNSNSQAPDTPLLYTGETTKAPTGSSGYELSEQQTSASESSATTEPPTEVEPSTTFEAPISPEIHTEFLSEENGVIQLNAWTEPAGQPILWSSSNTKIASVTGGIVTIHSDGVVVISATVAGYSDITSKVEIAISERKDYFGGGEIRYFENRPTGIDTASDFYKNLSSDYQIFGSKEEAIESIQNGLILELGTETTCGVVFYHWCRHDSAAAWDTSETVFHTEEDLNRNWRYSHNRTTTTEKTMKNGESFNTFCCFYCADPALPDTLLKIDGSNWVPNYNLCFDSYWYFPTMINSCPFTYYQTVQEIRIDGQIINT